MWLVHPENVSISGLTPITYVSGSYTADSITEQCGLYEDNSNTLPAAQRNSLILACYDIMQLMDEGQEVGITVVGVSNAELEGEQLVSMAAVDSAIDPRVHIENFGDSGGSLGGILEPTSNYMTVKLPGFEATSVVENDQRRILIFDQPTDTIGNDNSNPRNIPIDDFPALIEWQADQTKAAIDVLKGRWPNLSVVILTPPTYSGYGGIYGTDDQGAPPADIVSKRPERMAYECGYGIRELIRRQLSGVVGYRHVEDGFPVMVWGPYVWSNGTTPNPLQQWDAGVAMTSLWEDYDPQDGIHPKGDGTGLELKWATRMLAYLKLHAGVRLVVLD